MPGSPGPVFRRRETGGTGYDQSRRARWRCAVKRTVRILSGVFGILLLTSLGSAGPAPGPMARWWQRSRMQQELGLQPDQIRQLDDIYFRFQSEILDLKNGVQKARLNLEQAMSAPQWDERQILDVARQLIEARNRLEMKHLEMTLAMRRVLRPEQWEKLQSLRRTFMSRWMMKHKGCPSQPPAPPPGEPRPPSGE